MFHDFWEVTTNSVYSPSPVSTVMRSLMALDHNIVAHGESEPSAGTRGLGGKERLKDLLPNLWRNAITIVTDMDCRRDPRGSPSAPAPWTRKLSPGFGLVWTA